MGKPRIKDTCVNVEHLPRRNWGQDNERKLTQILNSWVEVKMGVIEQKVFSVPTLLSQGYEKRVWVEGPEGWVLPVGATPVLLIFLAPWWATVGF